MLRIAICDDDREFCNQIRTYFLDSRKRDEDFLP